MKLFIEALKPKARKNIYKATKSPIYLNHPKSINQ